MNRRTVFPTVAITSLLFGCGGGGEPRDFGSASDTAVSATDTLPVAPPPASNAPVLEGVAPFEPVDEGASDAEFARFRAELLAAIERRDTAALLSVVVPEIRNTFGDDNGRAAFIRKWRLGEPDSEVWGVLERVLRNGGGFRSASGTRLFLAPYVYAFWPDEYDAFLHVATIAEDALVRAAPAAAAEVIGRLPYRIVRLGWPPSREEVGEAWTEIELKDGRRAWIAAEDVYSPVGYRAIFEERDGRWVMTTLIAGD